MNWSEEFIKLNEQITACKKCEHLCGKEKIYPTFGNFPSELNKVKLVLVGQAPGMPLKEELEWKNKKLDIWIVDELYKLTMKKSRFGKWINALLKESGITWDEVAFTNAVKCFPLEHKISDEMRDNCIPYLKEQIKHVNPVVYVVFGKFALEVISEKQFEEKMEHLHGQLIEANGKKIICSYHPGFLFKKQKKESLKLSLQLSTKIKETLQISNEKIIT